MELIKVLSMKYTIIPSDTHATQDITHLGQGVDEFLDDYMHHMNKFLSKNTKFLT